MGFLRRTIIRKCPNRLSLSTCTTSTSRDCSFYILTFIFVIYFVIIFNGMRPGVHLQCPCNEFKKTEERVQKYLSIIIEEKNLLTNRTVIEEAEMEHPFLPVRFLAESEIQGKRCLAVPGLFDIKHRNNLWQEATVGLTTFLLFSAYVDHRDEKEGPLVRILAMADSGWPVAPTCQFYTHPNGEPIRAVKAIRTDYIHWQHPVKDKWYPYLITCRVGTDERVLPKVVSLVGYPCLTPTNALNIKHYDRSGKRKGMALCHKYLFNPATDYSLRLIEWLEAARAFGVDQVTLYSGKIHSNVHTVLSYYQNTGFIHWIPWTNPGDQMNVPSLQRAFFDTQRFATFTDENIPFTDCFLRHIGSHRYVAVFDIDEFIFPVVDGSMTAMADAAFNRWISSVGEGNLIAKPPTSYLARTSYFFHNVTNTETLRKLIEEINIKSLTLPKFQKIFRMLSHTTRSAKFMPPPSFTKAIHDTSRALALHAHYALSNLEGEVDKNVDLYNLQPHNEGFSAHFRDKCQGEDQTECDERFRPFLTNDTTLWQYGNAIVRRSVEVMEKLKLLS